MAGRHFGGPATQCASVREREKKQHWMAGSIDL